MERETGAQSPEGLGAACPLTHALYAPEYLSTASDTSTLGTFRPDCMSYCPRRSGASRSAEHSECPGVTAALILTEMDPDGWAAPWTNPFLPVEPALSWPDTGHVARQRSRTGSLPRGRGKSAEF